MTTFMNSSWSFHAHLHAITTKGVWDETRLLLLAFHYYSKMRNLRCGGVYAWLHNGLLNVLVGKYGSNA